MTKIFLVTPTNGTAVNTGCFQSAIALSYRLGRAGIDVAHSRNDGSALSMQRDLSGALFLQDRSFTHFLTFDSDQTFPGDLAETFLSFEKDAVGAIYPKRRRDTGKIAELVAAGHSLAVATAAAQEFVFAPMPGPIDPADGLYPAKWVGLGFILIARRAMERIIEQGLAPDYSNRLTTQPRRLPALFRELEQPNGDRLPDDESFCTRARQAGVDVWGYGLASVGHIGSTVYDTTFAEWAEAQNKIAATRRPMHLAKSS